jgi:hypothetical protein
MKPIELLANAVRRIESLFPGYFPEAKHNHYADFGWPTTLQFDQFYSMYSRNGLARAGVNKTALKTWEEHPFLLESDQKHEETETEKEIRQRFSDLRLWQMLAKADRRSMVGKYAAVILRVADSKPFREPVDNVIGGLDALVEVIPAWEGQLTVAEWDTEETSETYGKPTMFSFNEAAIGGDKTKTRSFEVHPDRVLIWSEDGTVHGSSMLEPGYNDLMTLEKISGAGGEGFWKNAKSSPVLKADSEIDLKEMARSMGVAEDELADAMDEQVGDWQKGFDKLLFLQGIEAKTLDVNLPSPEHFFSIALQSFAASIDMPVKILVGMQTGERASKEDAQEWAQTNKSRRTNTVIPNIMEFVGRLERFGILDEKDWHLSWTDLTESSMEEKIDRADKMADTNQKMQKTGEIVFTHDEIRDVVGLEPLSEAEKYVEEDNPDDLPPSNE